MIQPDENRLFDALEATWPPMGVHDAAPWRVFDGAGGGKRVSAAIWRGSADAIAPDALTSAEHVQTSLGQTPLVMVRPEQTALDDVLAQNGYRVIDPVRMMIAPSEALAQALPLRPLNGPPRYVQGEMPLAIMKEVWRTDGIGPARIDVMRRVAHKAYLLGRDGDRPAGCAFVGIDENIAMVHALTVLPEFRRLGLGAVLTKAAARIALESGASWLALAVTRDNSGANTLYEGLGFVEASAYHYRIKDEA